MTLAALPPPAPGQQALSVRIPRDQEGNIEYRLTAWFWTYNHERPNMALGSITPKQKLAMGILGRLKLPLLKPPIIGGIISCQFELTLQSLEPLGSLSLKERFNWESGLKSRV